MSKGLEALKEICGYYYQSPQYKLIEKELKALEIIKTKKVNVMIFLGCDNLEEYNKHPLTWNYLTQEEYDLLKEVLR